MEFFDRMKSKLYRSGPDKPIDVTQAIRQAMDRGATPMSRERTVAPNHFEISISPETDAAFEQWGKEALLQEFVRDANAYATEQNYSLTGSVYVEFTPLNPEQRRLEVKARSVSGARPLSGSEPVSQPSPCFRPPSQNRTRRLHRLPLVRIWNGNLWNPRLRTSRQTPTSQRTRKNPNF